MTRETIEHYIQRKKAKGTYGRKKAGRFRLGRGHDELVEVHTGICPCPYCGHEGSPMLICDPEYKDCHCCNGVCS